MVGDLRTKLEPVGRLDVLDGVAEKALEYIGSRKENELSGEELIAHAKALSQLGEVRMGQGRSEEALGLFQKSLERATAALRLDSSSPQARFTVAMSQFWLSNTYRLRNEIPRAFEHARAYQALTMELATEFPSKDEYQLEAAYAHTIVGMLLEAQRKFDEALVQYRRALEIKQAFAATRPEDDRRQEDVARTLNKMGFALWKAGALREAQQQFEQEVAIRESVVTRQPRDMRWRQELASAHSFLATVLEDQGLDDRALAHRQADVAQHEELVAFDSENASLRRNLAIARASLARRLAEKNDVVEALALMRLAETDLGALLAIETDRPTWRADLMRVRIAHGRVALLRGAYADARAKAQQVISDFEPQDRAGRHLLGAAYLLMGDASIELRDAGAAHAAWAKSAELLQPEDPASSQVRELDSWARALIRLGRREEARAVIARLRSHGYASSTFASFVTSEGY